MPSTGKPAHPALESGSRVPVTYRPPDDVKALLRAAAEQGRPVGSVLTEALRAHLAQPVTPGSPEQ